MTVATWVIAAAAVVQAFTAGFIAWLTKRLVQTTEKYTVATQELAAQTTAMAEATRELTVQAAAEGDTSRRMADATAKLADETARQARLQHLDDYRDLINAIALWSDQLITPRPEDRPARLDGWRDRVVERVDRIPEPTRSYLTSALRFARAIAEGIEQKTLTEGQVSFAITRLSISVGLAMGAVLRGEDVGVWTLPEYEGALEWIRLEASKLGAP